MMHTSEFCGDSWNHTNACSQTHAEEWQLLEHKMQPAAWFFYIDILPVLHGILLVCCSWESCQKYAMHILCTRAMCCCMLCPILDVCQATPFRSFFSSHVYIKGRKLWVAPFHTFFLLKSILVFHHLQYAEKSGSRRLLCLNVLPVTRSAKVWCDVSDFRVVLRYHFIITTSSLTTSLSQQKGERNRSNALSCHLSLLASYIAIVISKDGFGGLAIVLCWRIRWWWWSQAGS